MAEAVVEEIGPAVVEEIGPTVVEEIEAAVVVCCCDPHNVSTSTSRDKKRH